MEEAKDQIAPFIYCGELKGRSRHGHGTYMYQPGGIVYHGQWHEVTVNDPNQSAEDIQVTQIDGPVAGLKHGQGVLQLPDGSVFQGAFVVGEIQGMGQRHYPDGSLYDGSWYGGERDGEGVFTKPDGERYEGQWRNNRRNGEGKAVLPSGEVYVGAWKDNKRNGVGILSATGGVMYTGCFKDNARDGQGKMTYPNGGVYEGSWRSGMREGFGIFMSGLTGLSHDGLWSEDRPCDRPQSLIITVPGLSRLASEQQAAAFAATASHTTKTKLKEAKSSNKSTSAAAQADAQRRPSIVSLKAGSLLPTIHITAGKRVAAQVMTPIPATARKDAKGAAPPPPEPEPVIIPCEKESGRLLRVTLYQVEGPGEARSGPVPMIVKLPSAMDRYPPELGGTVFSIVGPGAHHGDDVSLASTMSSTASLPLAATVTLGTKDQPLPMDHDSQSAAGLRLYMEMDGTASTPGVYMLSYDQGFTVGLDFLTTGALNAEPGQSAEVQLLASTTGCRACLVMRAGHADGQMTVVSLAVCSGGSHEPRHVLDGVQLGVWHSLVLVFKGDVVTICFDGRVCETDAVHATHDGSRSSSWSFGSRGFHGQLQNAFTADHAIDGGVALKASGCYEDARQETRRTRQDEEERNKQTEQAGPQGDAPEVEQGARLVMHISAHTRHGVANVDGVTLPNTLKAGVYALVAQDMSRTELNGRNGDGEELEVFPALQECSIQFLATQSDK